MRLILCVQAYALQHQFIMRNLGLPRVIHARFCLYPKARQFRLLGLIKPPHGGAIGQMGIEQRGQSGEERANFQPVALGHVDGHEASHGTEQPR